MRIPAVRHEKNNPLVRIYLNFCDSLNLTKNIAVAKSHTTPSRVLRSRHTLELMEAATAMPQAPHRGFSTTIDRSTRSPDVSKKPKATKAGLDAAMHVLRN